MRACTVCARHAESAFRVDDMHCHEEVALIERRLRQLPGVEDFSTDVMARRLLVHYDASKLTAPAIAAALADAGMPARSEAHEGPSVSVPTAGRWNRPLLGLSGAACVAGLAVELGLARPGPAALLYGAAIFLGVPLTAGKAWRALRLGQLDINVLMLVAAGGAVVLGQLSEGAAVVVLFAVAQALEARTLERARAAIGGLVESVPVEALVRDGSGERILPIDQVGVGTLIVVKPGQKIPLDGTVSSGRSAVNQAPITGESVPVDKEPGDRVFAGTLNGRGALEIAVTHLPHDTMLARVVRLVERARAQRAPSEQLVDRFARVYTPAVLALSVAIVIVPPALLGGDWGDWFYRGLVLLVVSCPCALVISTPVSVVAALASAARHGVLIKGGAHLERMAEVRCVAFDKTGTLTRSAPEVIRAVALEDESETLVVAMAAAVERRSTHPIAKAITDYADMIGASHDAAIDVRAIDGRGAEGIVAGTRVLVGNHRLFEELGLCTPAAHVALASSEHDGATPVLVARAGQVVGVLAVANRVRAGSRETIDRLRGQGVREVVMLTGDTPEAAGRLAREVGIHEVRADLLPDGKVAAVLDLRRTFGSVAMVGDGINDAPALASADVGIVMGAAGSDVAIESADVALMADDLTRIPYAIRLGQEVTANIRANMILALALKGAFVVAAVSGVATLWMAVLADTGASVLVVANALRLLRSK